ncbi:MAG: hypothetical protein AAGA77_22330 [Bacteroidota bacterium]
MTKYFITGTIIVSLLLYLSVELFSQSNNVGIGVETPLNKLHVSGSIRSDSLAGIDTRIPIVNPDGVIIPLPNGLLDQVLKMTSDGPQWMSINSNNSGNDCPLLNCPTMFSLTFTDYQMYFGECMRYCGTLEENGFDDWRIATIEEVFYIAPYIPAEIYGIWTQTPFIDTSDPNHPGSRRIVTYNLTTGAMTVIDPSTPQWCKCVR